MYFSMFMNHSKISTKYLKKASALLEPQSGVLTQSDLYLFLIYVIVAVSILLFIQRLNLLSTYNIALRISLELYESVELSVSRNSIIRVFQKKI